MKTALLGLFATLCLSTASVAQSEDFPEPPGCHIEGQEQWDSVKWANAFAGEMLQLGPALFANPCFQHDASQHIAEFLHAANAVVRAQRSQQHAQPPQMQHHEYNPNGPQDRSQGQDL